MTLGAELMEDRALRHAKLLVVDDTEDNLILMRKALMRAGYLQVVTVTNPLEAAEVFRREQPDMVLVDYRMPPVDGFYVLREIRAYDSSAIPVPAIMLTAGASEEVKQRALQAGFTDFLNKDFDFTELILRIRNALHIYQLNRQLLKNNELLEETVRVRTLQIHQAHRDTLAKLAIAAEFRDDETGEHTRRVGYVAAQIAMTLGLPKSFIDDIRMAAPLHDVGKIGIPDMILQKPAALTREEYLKVREHAQIGAQILRGSDEPIVEMARSVALTHHEKWDGTGYPHGLSGEQIPISGRIVALADAFDAMTNDRHYRKAISVDLAVSELRACSGTHFDPAVVEAFIIVVEKGLHIADETEGRAPVPFPQFRLFPEQPE